MESGQGLPLDAELCGLVGLDLDDQRLDHHLRPAHVELFDDRPDVPVQRLRRRDDQRIGRRVGLDHPCQGAAGGGGRTSAGWRLRRRLLLRLLRLLSEQTLLRPSGHTRSGERPPAGGRNERGVVGQHRAQQWRELHRLGVAQVHDIDVARRQARAVEPLDQLLGKRHSGRAGGAQDQRVGTRLGHDLDPLAAVRGLARGARALVEDTVGDRGHLHGQAVLELHHFAFGRAWTVDRLDDPRDTAQVLRVIGDHQRVVRRVGGDRVVGRNQRPQHRHHAGRRFEAQPKDLRDDLISAWRRCGRHHDPATLQLRVGLGHDPDDAVRAGRLDDRESLQPQRCEQLLVGLLLGDRPLGDQGEGSANARIDDELAARVLANRPHGRFEVGVDEVQHHRVSAALDAGRRGARWRLLGRAGERHQGNQPRQNENAQPPRLRGGLEGRRIAAQCAHLNVQC